MSTVIRPSVDAWVDQNVPTANHSDTARLSLRGTGASTERQVFLFFGKGFPLDAIIFSATLKLYIQSFDAAGGTVTAERITTRWREDRVRWEERPTVVTTNSDAAIVPASQVNGAVVEFDLTAMMTDVAGGAAWHGVRLKLGSNVPAAFHSSDAPLLGLRPHYEVEYRMPPEPPDRLHPNGDSIIATDEPILKWQYGDEANDAEVEQASSQVMISTSSNFTVDDIYDSGKVANVESQWNLDGEFTLPDENTTYYWRVKIWDDTDTPSEWSDVATFSFDIPTGTLTITNPASSGALAYKVDETTPPLAWTFTGATQLARSVRVRRTDVPDERAADEVFFPREVTASTSVTMPRGFIKTGRQYEMEVRVWDDVSRAATPGLPPYSKAVRAFTYERSGAPASVPTLTATPLDTSPEVELEWTRATMPDYFALRVDDEEVEDRIDPTDVFVSGTTYSMRYWAASPRATHTYEVEAVVLDGGRYKHSDGNDTATATTSPSGIYVIDPDDHSFIRFVGSTSIDMAIREVGQTYEILGNRRPVRITETLGGYAGTAEGMIEGGKAKRNLFFELKGRMKELRLIAGDVNIPIILEEISAVPHGEIPGDRMFPATFSFFQSGEFDRTFDVVGG